MYKNNIEKLDDPAQWSYARQEQELMKANRGRISPDRAEVMIMVLHNHVLDHEIPGLLRNYGPKLNPEQIWDLLKEHSPPDAHFKLEEYEKYNLPQGYWAAKMRAFGFS
jgi:hypothetical protein